MLAAACSAGASSYSARFAPFDTRFNQDSVPTHHPGVLPPDSRHVHDGGSEHGTGGDAHPDAATRAGLLEELLARTERDVRSLSDEIVGLQRQAAMGAVAGLLAHEVNNILTPALTRIRLARRLESSESDRAGALAVTDDAITRTAEIARAILALGRGAVNDQPAGAAVLDVARQAVDTLGRDLARDGITCELRIEPGLAAAIAPVSLQQVLVNLLQNARRALLDPSFASPSEGRRITVTADAVVSSTWNAGGVEILVTDNGPGISPADRERIFQPFTRRLGATRSDPEREPGTGLGLTVCRELVHAVGGTIGVEPAPDTGGPDQRPAAGACFAIRLPRGVVPMDAEAA